MSDDHLLLQDICEEQSITAKQLASRCGRAICSVYRYLSGEATIPTLIWRTVYGISRDVRIVKLMTGEVPVMVAQVAEEMARIDKPAVRHLLAMRKKQIAFEAEAINITADGIIDKKDRHAVARYRKVFPEMMELQFQIYKGICDNYDRATQSKGARP